MNDEEEIRTKMVFMRILFINWSFSFVFSFTVALVFFFQDNTVTPFGAKVQKTEDVKVEKNDVACLLGKHSTQTMMAFLLGYLCYLCLHLISYKHGGCNIQRE